VKQNEPLPLIAARGVPLIYTDRADNILCAECATESVRDGDENSAQRFELQFVKTVVCSECGAEIRGADTERAEC